MEYTSIDNAIAKTAFKLTAHVHICGKLAERVVFFSVTLVVVPKLISYGNGWRTRDKHFRRKNNNQPDGNDGRRGRRRHVAVIIIGQRIALDR